MICLHNVRPQVAVCGGMFPGTSRSQLESNYVHFYCTFHMQGLAVLLQVIEGTSVWHRQFQLVHRLQLIGTTWKEINIGFFHSLKVPRMTSQLETCLLASKFGSMPCKVVLEPDRGNEMKPDRKTTDSCPAQKELESEKCGDQKTWHGFLLGKGLQIWIWKKWMI